MRPTTLLLVTTLALGGCPKKGKPEAPADTSPVAEPAVVGEASAPATAEEGGADAKGADTADSADKATSREIAKAVAKIQTGNQADWMTARNDLKALSDKASTNPWVWYNLGVAYQRLGASEDALDAFTRATRIDATCAPAWRGQAVVLQSLGDADGALRRVDQGLAASPDDLDLHIAKVAALRAVGKPAQAVDAAKEALKINTQSLELYNLIGLAYLDLGNLDLARFVFEKADAVVDGAESYAPIQANLGWIYGQKGERYAAEYRLKQATQADPTYVPGLVQLARLYLDDHNYADTVPLLETARSRAPDNADVLLNLGVAYRGVGRTEEARQAFERAAQLEPANLAPVFDLGILLADDVKDYDGAIQRFQTYVDKGGARADDARTYIDEVDKERKRIERQRKKEEQRKARAAEQAERDKLLKEAEKKKAAEPPPEEAPSPEPSPWDAPGQAGSP